MLSEGKSSKETAGDQSREKKGLLVQTDRSLFQDEALVRYNGNKLFVKIKAEIAQYRFASVTGSKINFT